MSTRFQELPTQNPDEPDVRSADRFGHLSEKEQRLLGQVDAKVANHPSDYEQQVLKAFPVSEYHQMLVEHRDTVGQREAISPGEDWAIVAITDHNVCDYATALAIFAWEQRHKSRLIILPGVELDVAFPVTAEEKTEAHVILVYAPGTQPSDIRVAIRDHTNNNWTFGEAAETPSLPELIHGLRNHSDYPAVAIAAHVGSGKGVRAAAKKQYEEVVFTPLDAAIARTSAEIDCNREADIEALKARLEQLQRDREREAEQISIEVLKLLGSCGFDALQVSCKKDEIHYRRLHRFIPSFGRAVPIAASDAHAVSEVFSCEGNIPYLKLPIQSASEDNARVLSQIRHAIRYGETRFSYCSPGQVTKWISGIEIKPESPNAVRFWPFDGDGVKKDRFVLPLSRNLNCLVGGRGSGKSAAIEAISFLTEPAKFQGKNKKGDEDLDWYKRARATLSGCEVRVMWQSIGGGTDLPKGAMFGSRYFNPSGEHSSVSYTDLDDKEIKGSSVTLDPPQVFRARDIEGAARPDLLRQLFDRLVGERIPEVEKEITSLREQLSTQREDLVNTALRIMELTQEDTPLREYLRRKIAYEDANRPEVKPFYKTLDDANAAESIAADAKKRWEEANKSADLTKNQTGLVSVLDSVQKKVFDKEGVRGRSKPASEGRVKTGHLRKGRLISVGSFDPAVAGWKESRDGESSEDGQGILNTCVTQGRLVGS
jgi:hypothetical protein